MVLLAFAAGGSSSERKRSRPIRAFSATPNDGQRPCRTLLKIPAEPSPELLIPGAAAQTRVVSLAAIRLGSWESARAFKGIICDDISEFESHMPSHAVWSLWRYPVCRNTRAANVGRSEGRRSARRLRALRDIDRKSVV